MFEAIRVFRNLAMLASFAAALPNLEGKSDGAITWSPCPPEAQYSANVECGFLSAPLDYCKTNGEQILLGMTRLKANGTNRLGSLIFNPGGPGGVASSDISRAGGGEYIFPAVILEHYDLIGLDPRGVGISTPIKCDPTQWNERVSLFPTTEGAFDAFVAHNKAFGDSCANLTGSLIDHLSTTNVAKDMELVRAALGEGKLNYLGVSYGSLIGTRYSELYPENINRMALDGVVDHSMTEIDTTYVLATAFELTLQAFFEWAATDDLSALKGQSDIPSLFDALVANASVSPIPAPGCSQDAAGPMVCFPNVTHEDIIFTVNGAIGDALGPRSQWPLIALGLAQAVTENNATLLSPPYATDEIFSFFPSVAVSCQDWLQTTDTLLEKVRRQTLLATSAPHSRGQSAQNSFAARCIGWPARVEDPQHMLKKSAMEKVPPILLSTSTIDPATPLVWAQGVRAQIPNSILVNRVGPGHTSYLLYGQITDAINTFLVSGVMPADGSTYQS